MSTEIVAIKVVARFITIIIAVLADVVMLSCALCDLFGERWEKILLVVNIVAFISIVCWAWF